MGERLSHGARIHNRKEKSLARKEGRKPNLLKLTLPSIERERPEISRQPERPTFPLSFTPTREPFSTTRQLATETVVKKERKKPTDMSFMTAGMRLSSGARGIMPDYKKTDEYLSDKEAVSILENLEDGIRSGKIVTQKEIAEQTLRLGHKMGPLGSVSTEIDVAAWGVLDAIKENKGRIVK